MEVDPMNELLVAAEAAAPADDSDEPAYRRLTPLLRFSIVALHNDNRSERYIANHLHVSKNTVRKWITHHELFGNVNSGSRSGRPRCTDEATDTNIAVSARVQQFTSPRQVKRKLQLDVSSRTIDRRLQEAGLFGRVARHKRRYSAAELRLRLFRGGIRWLEAKEMAPSALLR